MRNNVEKLTSVVVFVVVWRGDVQCATEGRQEGVLDVAAGEDVPRFRDLHNIAPDSSGLFAVELPYGVAACGV